MKNIKDKYYEIFHSSQVQNYAKIICELAEECWDKKLSDSTGFSISQRLPGTAIVLVDKSGTGFRRNKIIPDDLLLIDLAGNLLFQPNGKNPRLAPVNVEIHLAGYRNSDAGGCIHWHDPFTNSFACYGRTIFPLTLQSKLIGNVPCVMVDDRREKKKISAEKLYSEVPTGLHVRPDVYFVMRQVGDRVGEILKERNAEFKRHGIVINHYEHGLFSFGRHIEEAFENGYRAYRNAQTIIYSRLLSDYPDARLRKNSSLGDLEIING